MFNSYVELPESEPSLEWLDLQPQFLGDFVEPTEIGFSPTKWGFGEQELFEDVVDDVCRICSSLNLQVSNCSMNSGVALRQMRIKN